MQSSRHYFRVIAIGLLVFLLDRISKLLVFKYIPLMWLSPFWYPYGGIGIFHDFFGVDFSINHATNKGAAWGALAEFQIYLLALRILLVVGMVIYVAFYNKKPSWDIPLTIIIAGAAGNVVDYFVYGHVIDMLHFVFWGYDYPVFNVADASIFIGLAWMLIVSRSDKSSIKHCA